MQKKSNTIEIAAGAEKEKRAGHLISNKGRERASERESRLVVPLQATL